MLTGENEHKTDAVVRKPLTFDPFLGLYRDLLVQPSGTSLWTTSSYSYPLFMLPHFKVTAN